MKKMECDGTLIRGVCKAILEAKASASPRLTDMQIQDIEWLQDLHAGTVGDRKRFVSVIALLRKLRDNAGIRAHWDSSAFTTVNFPSGAEELFEDWIASCAQDDTQILIKTET